MNVNNDLTNSVGKNLVHFDIIILISSVETLP